MGQLNYDGITNYTRFENTCYSNRYYIILYNTDDYYIASNYVEEYYTAE